MEKELWKGKYFRDRFPNFSCPQCNTGYLSLDQDSLLIKEPLYSQEALKNDCTEPEWSIRRFIAFLTCSNPVCGEKCALSGEAKTVEVRSKEDEWGEQQIYKDRLIPHNIFPAPSIIKLPDALPVEVETEIQLAFQLYWVDLGASSSRLRTSVERILDDLKVDKTSENKDGKKSRLSLGQRITEYEKVDSDHASTMDALRLVGNVGTHEAKLSREALLDAFEVYEHTLAELYEEKTAKIQALKQKLIQSRGKY